MVDMRWQFKSREGNSASWGGRRNVGRLNIRLENDARAGLGNLFQNMTGNLRVGILGKVAQ
jgi:hypothetical protein